MTLEMIDGATAPKTCEVARELEAPGYQVIEWLERGHPANGNPLLSDATVTVGQGPRLKIGGLSPESTLDPRANLATIVFNLLGNQQRQITTGEVGQAWHEEVGTLPYVWDVTFSGEIIDPGRPIEAVLAHPDPERLSQIT